MTVINYSNARKNFKSIIDQVNDDKDEIIIASKNHNVVLLSEETYNQFIETIYLLGNLANVKHLAESIEQYNKGKTVQLDE